MLADGRSGVGGPEKAAHSAWHGREQAVRALVAALPSSPSREEAPFYTSLKRVRLVYRMPLRMLGDVSPSPRMLKRLKHSVKKTSLVSISSTRLLQVLPTSPLKFLFSFCSNSGNFFFLINKKSINL